MSDGHMTCTSPVWVLNLLVNIFRNAQVTDLTGREDTTVAFTCAVLATKVRLDILQDAYERYNGTFFPL